MIRALLLAWGRLAAGCGAVLLRLGGWEPLQLVTSFGSLDKVFEG